MYSYGSPHTAVQKQDDQHERTFSSCVRIQDVVLKTCLGRWTIGRSGERGSGISVLPARYDDDDDLLRVIINSNPFLCEEKKMVQQNLGIITACVCNISKLAITVEGGLKAPFSIATTPRCQGGHNSFSLDCSTLYFKMSWSMKRFVFFRIYFYLCI